LLGSDQQDEDVRRAINLALLALTASGWLGVWLLQGLWVAPFCSTLGEIAEPPLLTWLAGQGVLAGATTLLVGALLVGAARRQSRLLLLLAAVAPALCVVAQVYAVTQPLFEMNTLTP
jgi:hypothetical protein